MKVIHLFVVSTLFLFSFSSIVCAQKEKKVRGEYTYIAPENISLEQAKAVALERAKIQAIANEFGTVVTQTNSTVVNNKNGQSIVDFTSIGGSEVRGEWIETIGTPKYTTSFENGAMVVKVVLSGRIREIVSAKTPLSIKVLRNGTEERFESENFKNNDDLYISFQSPLNGCLAIYLVDSQQMAYCLLPYRSQTNGVYQIEANRHYTFFSAKHVHRSISHTVDEYVMTTDRTSEQNQIYIVFSTNSFVKAIDSRKNETTPRELTFQQFQKWLSECRKHDKMMQVEVKNITITK